VHLIRLAVFPAETSVIESLPIRYDELRIVQGNVAVGFGNSIATIRGKPSLTIIAKMPLVRKPKISKSGIAVVPEKSWRILEASIEHVANAFIIASGKPSSLLSPEPCIAIQFDNDEEREFLEGATGIKTPGRQFELGLASFEIDIWTHLNALADRQDGMALLENAINQSRAGRFRDTWRIFERAFATGGHSLIMPLSVFLGANGMDYSEKEIKNWAVIRDRLTHADKSKDVMLQRDLDHPVHRALQAGYDVLFNKLCWRSNDVARRDLWFPGCGVSAKPNMAFVYQGKALTMPISLLDDFRAFPIELGFNIAQYPENWWPKAAPCQSFQLSDGLFVEVKTPRDRDN
jgi:hypothetical protein